VEVLVARSLRRRLVGLALRRRPPPNALLIPRCRSVHTFGMRFPLDLVWLDGRGTPIRIDRDVPPWRVRGCRGAAAVLEAPAGTHIFPSMAHEHGNKLLAGIDPRQPIYRDSYNEYFVLVLSAVGAAIVAPLALYLAMVFSEKWSVWVFLAASAAIELVLIFGLGRPQMKPLERVGWALLWGGTALALGACFYYLVADPTL
jgi:uncharacterized membrane protein (UPF0127 family)